MQVTNPLLLSFPPPEDATGFFLFFPLTYCFSFSARSRYWTHFCLMLSLDFSPWASSTVAKNDVSSLKQEQCAPEVSRTLDFVFSPQLHTTVQFDLGNALLPKFLHIFDENCFNH